MPLSTYPSKTPPSPMPCARSSRASATPWSSSPSENFTSPAVLEAVGSVLTNKYAEGYPRKRYYGGCEKVDIVEDLARERACAAVRRELRERAAPLRREREPGRVRGAHRAGRHGARHEPGRGRPSHARLAGELSGRHYDFASYGVDAETGTINYDEVERIAKEVRPKLIVGGASAYPRIIDFERMAAIAREVDAYFMVDMAHIAGLVAAGAHRAPFRTPTW